MKPAHMLVLVSCVVLACGGGCFGGSHCTPPPAPPPAPTATVPAEQPAQAQAPAPDADGPTVAVQVPNEER